MSLPELGFTDNDAKHILATYLHSYILEILVYGMYTIMYCVALYLTLNRGSGRPRRVHLAVFITIMWLLVTVHMSIAWELLDISFIQDTDSRGAQLMSVFTTRVPLGVISFITSSLSFILGECWRCWVAWAVYGRQWFILMVPVSLITVGTVARIVRGILILACVGPDPFRSVTSIPNTMEIIFQSTMVCNHFFCSASIVYQLVTVSGFRKSLRTYRGLLEVIVESAVVYGGIYLTQVGLIIYSTYFVTGWNEPSRYLQGVENVITAVIPTLIIARVSAGHTRPNDSDPHVSFPESRTTMQSLEGLMYATGSSIDSESGGGQNNEGYSQRRAWREEAHS